MFKDKQILTNNYILKKIIYSLTKKSTRFKNIYGINFNHVHKPFECNINK